METRQQILEDFDNVISQYKERGDMKNAIRITHYKEDLEFDTELMNGYRAASAKLIFSEAHLTDMGDSFYMFHFLCTTMSDDNLFALPEDLYQEEAVHNGIQSMIDYGVMVQHPITDIMPGKVIFMVDPLIARRTDISSQQFYKIIEIYQGISDPGKRRSFNFLTKYPYLQEIKQRFQCEDLTIMSLDLS